MDLEDQEALHPAGRSSRTAPPVGTTGDAGISFYYVRRLAVNERTIHHLCVILLSTCVYVFLDIAIYIYKCTFLTAIAFKEKQRVYSE